MDSKDFQLLVALHGDARQSYRSLGLRVSLTAPAVRERVNRLRSRGVLQGYGLWTDPSIFDRDEVLVFFQHDRTRQNFVDVLAAPNVAWVGWKLEGGVTVAVWTHDPSESINEISTFLREKPTGHTYTERRLFAPLSTLDWQIIDALIDDPTIPFRTLTGETGLSPKTVRKHLRFLLQSEIITISPRLGAAEGSGDLVYTLATAGRIPMSEIRQVMGDAALIHQTQKPPMKMVLCRSSDLGDLTAKAIALRKLAEVESATVSLNREVLFANKFIHKLVREHVVESEKRGHVED